MNQPDPSRAIRFVFLLLGLIAVLLGFSHGLSNPTVDWWLWGPRILIFSVAVGIAGASIGQPVVRNHLPELFTGFLWLMVAYFFADSMLRGFGAANRFELAVVVLAATAACACAAESARALLFYLAYVAVLAGAAYAFSSEVAQHGSSMGMLMIAVLLIGWVGRDRVRLSRALVESDRRWASLVENHPDPMIVTRDGIIEYANPSAGQLMEVRPDQLVGRSVLDIVHPDDRATIERRMTTATTGEAMPVVEYRIPRASGDAYLVEVISVPVEFRGDMAIQSVIHDITDQRRHEDRLMEAKEDAEAESQAKSSFLANMSHEIRSPLTNIIGFADLLAVEVPDDLGEHVHSIQRSGRRLQQTLDSVLRFAQLESGTITFSPAVGDVRPVVEDVVHAHEVQAEEKNLELIYLADEEPIEATFDPGLLDRVVTNLVSNAVKYTDVGEVRVTLTGTEDDVTIEVQDTGIGMSESFQSKLFDAFQQESEGLGRSYEGVGLGLAITRRLVSLAGGEMAVESTKGEGSTFHISMPREMPGYERAETSRA